MLEKYEEEEDNYYVAAIPSAEKQIYQLLTDRQMDGRSNRR